MDTSRVGEKVTCSSSVSVSIFTFIYRITCYVTINKDLHFFRIWSVPRPREYPGPVMSSSSSNAFAGPWSKLPTPLSSFM